MMHPKNINKKPETNNPNEQKPPMTVNDIANILESKRLVFYRSKENFAAATNLLMETVDMMINTISVFDDALGKELEKNKKLQEKIHEVEAKLKKKK